MAKKIYTVAVPFKNMQGEEILFFSNGNSLSLSEARALRKQMGGSRCVVVKVLKVGKK